MTSTWAVPVRAARAEDAEAICQVLVRSIREVCGPDYGGDEALLERWCRNKTPEIVGSWLADPENLAFVAPDSAERVVGVGLVHVSGEIRLCYVLPEVLGRGVGHALLERLTSEGRKLNLSRLTLTSTSTARRFYEHHGFVPAGPPEPRGPGWQYPMSKPL